MSTELRPITDADFDALLELINRTRNADGIPEVLAMEELVNDLTGDEAEISTDSILAVIDGVPAGYASTIYLPSETRLERCYIDGLVAPEYRGSGLGRQLLAWGKARAAEQLLSSGSELPKYIHVDDYDFVESAHRLFARMGFTPVRYFDQLLRPLVDLPPLEQAEVDGIKITPWDDDRSEEIRQVKNESFEDHWGSTPTGKVRWDMMLQASTRRTDLSWLALNEEGTVVGYCINDRYEDDDAVSGRRDGWIATVGTLRDYRRRGIASALIVRSMHSFVEAGLDHAILGVDSDSPSGAPRLYRSLGFEPHTRTITHRIQID